VNLLLWIYTIYEISWRLMYLHLTQLPLWEWLQVHLCTCSLSMFYSFYAFNSLHFLRIHLQIPQYLFPQFPHLHFLPHPRRYRLRHSSFTCHLSGAAVATFLFFCLRSSLSLGTLFSLLRIAFVRLCWLLFSYGMLC
jgi:hypothetical protein